MAIESLGVGAVTDSAGYFAIVGLPGGSYELVVSLIGWSTVRLNVTVPARQLVEVRLKPKPVTLDPVAVRAADRFRQRRQAAPHSARVFGQAELAAAGNFMVDALRDHGVQVTDCSGERHGHCVYIRGSVTRPAVCINDMPAMDGLAELARYPAATLDFVEIYGAGRMIRAYTHDYIARVTAGEVVPAAIDMNLRRC